MGWMETCAVDERMRFVIAVEQREEPFAVVCRRFGVSRKTGYKWLERFEEGGIAGLQDHSRAPLHHPQEVTDAIVAQLVATRRAHPTWGPRKVRAFLARRSPGMEWPVASTIGALFDREGLTVKRRLRRRSPPSSQPFLDCQTANDVWCIDFKGWFLTGDGARCEPLTLTDAHTRYLLRCQALRRTDGVHVWAVLDAAFREFGLPWRLRSDNGSPFASLGAGGLSRLAVKVVKAGVVPERIAPGKPQQNGRHERMHLTLLRDAASPPAQNLREQSRRFKNFQHQFNEERPHEALGDATPADHYTASSRRFDGILREPEYGSEYQVRRVRHNGDIRWRNRTIYVNQALVGELVGLIENGADGWTLSFGPILLGTIGHNEDRLRRPKGRACGHVDDARKSIAHMPTGATTTDLNETRIVLPMSPV